MRVLITGAAGMIGRKLTQRLTNDGALGGEAISAIDLLDVVPVSTDGGDGHRSIVADLNDPTLTDIVTAAEPDVVFHLAGVVSGEAETDMAKGYRVNLDGTRSLFDAIAGLDANPRVVFTSSIAVFGAPFPGAIPDDFHLTPLSSYGAQKAMGEALLADYTRRGLFDGIGIRLPTITVRPGRPNAAASGFFSGIIREPLSGQEAVLPVARTVRHTHASPRSAVSYLIRAAELDGDAVGPRRTLTMPSVSVTVQDQIDALERAAGEEAVGLIRDEADPAVDAIISTWPERFATERADALGFRCEQNYDEIIQVYIEDDLPSAAG